MGVVRCSAFGDSTGTFIEHSHFIGCRGCQRLMDRKLRRAVKKLDGIKRGARRTRIIKLRLEIFALTLVRKRRKVNLVLCATRML